jgi:hypothetical protein
MTKKSDWKSKEFLKCISNKTVFIIFSILSLVLLFFMMKTGGVQP